MGIRHGMKAKLGFFDCNRNLMQDKNKQDSIDYKTVEENISDSKNSADTMESEVTPEKDERRRRLLLYLIGSTAETLNSDVILLLFELY